MALRSPQHQHGRPAARNSQAGNSSNSNSDKKNIMLQKYLIDCRSFYSCLYCRTHLANHDELISRSFQGNRSRAYLFNSVINITTGQPVQRELNTGSHAVADIFCSNCATTIGWKYEKAYVDSQKYKEGKFIIELAHVVRENRHLELDKRDMFLRGLQPAAAPDCGGSAAKCSTICRPTDLGRSSIKPATNTTTTTTLGQLARGSLSPPSASSSSGSDASGGGGGAWSTSSPASSASSSSSFNAGLGPRMATASARFGMAAAAAAAADEGESSEDDEEDVLMFPFHDDLYGERASYSNLSLLRVGQQKRTRRSLHLDSAPYDWKYSTSSARVARPTSHLSLGAAPPAGSFPPSRTACGSPAARQRASNSSSSVEEEEGDEDGGGGVHGDDLDEIQFKLDPCNAVASTAPRAIGNQNCDQSGGHKGAREEAAASSSTRALDGPAPGGSGESARALEPNGAQPRALAAEMADCGPSSSSTAPPSPSRADSLSLDDEEFYDCCSDHLVANASAAL